MFAILMGVAPASNSSLTSLRPQVCWSRAHANTVYETFGQERKPETNGYTKTNSTLIEANMLISQKRVRYTEHGAKGCENPCHGDDPGDLISYPLNLNGFFTSSHVVHEAFAAWRLVGEHMTCERAHFESMSTNIYVLKLWGDRSTAVMSTGLEVIPQNCDL